MPDPRGEVAVETFTGGVFGENTLVLRCISTGAAILVDPGAVTQEALAEVTRSGSDVTAIVLTHSHIDHIEGVALAKRVTGAPILLHADAEELYRAGPMQAQWFGVELETPPPPDGRLEVGGLVEFGAVALEVRHTPGHAPGHVTLVGDGFAIVGDCVFRGSIGRTDLPGGDFERLMRAIREEILTLPDETVLHPGHGPETTVGFERTANPFLIPHYGGSDFG